MAPVLAIARSLREQIDWPSLRARVAASPYALAFFTPVEELRIAGAGTAEGKRLESSARRLEQLTATNGGRGARARLPPSGAAGAPLASLIVGVMRQSLPLARRLARYTQQRSTARHSPPPARRLSCYPRRAPEDEIAGWTRSLEPARDQIAGGFGLGGPRAESDRRRVRIRWKRRGVRPRRGWPWVGCSRRSGIRTGCGRSRIRRGRRTGNSGTGNPRGHRCTIFHHLLRYPATPLGTHRSG